MKIRIFCFIAKGVEYNVRDIILLQRMFQHKNLLQADRYGLMYYFFE